MLERLAKSKHSSLLQKFVTYDRKKGFITLAPCKIDLMTVVRQIVFIPEFKNLININLIQFSSLNNYKGI